MVMAVVGDISDLLLSGCWRTYSSVYKVSQPYTLLITYNVNSSRRKTEQWISCVILLARWWRLHVAQLWPALVTTSGTRIVTQKLLCFSFRLCNLCLLLVRRNLAAVITIINTVSWPDHYSNHAYSWQAIMMTLQAKAASFLLGSKVFDMRKTSLQRQSHKFTLPHTM